MGWRVFLVFGFRSCIGCVKIHNLRRCRRQAPNYTFIKGDICDAPLIAEILGKHDVRGIIHLAAESHVDRSIKDPLTFARTNVLGTLTLLQAAKDHWSAQAAPENGLRRLFYHISTDEVYGSLAPGDSLFT